MNQEQNNLNPNNFNTQGNNGIPNNQPLNNQSFNQGIGFNQQPINTQPQPTTSYGQPINQMNVQQPTPQPMNTFESGNTSNQNFNSKPPKKMNLGLIIGIVAAVAVATVGIVALFNKDDKSNSNNNETNNVEQSNVDLTIDETIPKTTSCTIVDNTFRDNPYKYQISLINLNRYTFLKEYTDEEYANPVITFDYDCAEPSSVETAYLYTKDFNLMVQYKIDSESTAYFPNFKESIADSIFYKQIGEPTINGDNNGYWYSYMNKDYTTGYKEGDPNNFNVNIYKEIDTVVETYTKRYILEIGITAMYENEVGKIRLNYFLNEIKDILKNEYNIDLSKLNIDMIKK